MSKPNDLSEIFSSLESPTVPKQPHHFEIFLGTDTDFTKLPTKNLADPVQRKSYERGETLSHAAQAIVNQLGETAEIGTGALSFSSPSVDVLNGPSTLGTEVGERIAQGVFLTLLAVARGKKTLQIAAHSRGAVEAIMVIKEIARIKKALQEQPNSSLFDILCQAPNAQDNSGIEAGVRKLFSTNKVNNETPGLRQKLLKGLNELEINPFLIDPVPGGSRFLLPTGWYSQWFYKEFDKELVRKPPVYILCRDERTCCFSPIVPEGVHPLILPGHHGTASGNRYNQQGVEVPATFIDRDTTTVQDLVLCKLFYFFDQCTGLFQKDKCSTINLEHEELDKVLNAFLDGDDVHRRGQILHHYIRILKNNDALDSFKYGSYRVLGAQYANKEKERIVHFRGHNRQSIRDVAPAMPKDFINEEHAQLYLREFFQIDELAAGSIDQLVNKITTILEQAIKIMVESQQLVSAANSPALEKDEKLAKLFILFKDVKGRETFFNSLSIMIDTISQKYLRNNLSQEEDRRLREVIEKPFDLLKEAKKKAQLNSTMPEEYRHIIAQCDELIQDGVKGTIERHYKSILQQTDELIVQISHLSQPQEHFRTVFQTFVAKLTEGENVPPELSRIKTNLESVNLEEIKSPAEIEKAIEHSIEILGEIPSETMAKIQAFISNKQQEFLQACFDVHQTSTKDYLINLERLYQLATTLQNDYPKLQQLVFEKIEINETDLRLRVIGLKDAGGNLLKQRKMDLRHKPEYISEAFFDLIKRQAISLGAPAPEVDDLLQERGKQASKIISLQEEAHKKEQERVLQQQQFAKEKSQLNEELQNQKEVQRRLEEELGKTKTTLEEAQERNNVLAKLGNDKEQSSFTLINTKLSPLTQNYLEHLFKEAQKHNPDLKKNKNGSFPQLTETPKNDAYNLVVKKFNLVIGLKERLDDLKTPLFSVRVADFTQELLRIEKDPTLRIHRNDGWFMHYLRSCLSLIATGVSKITGNRNTVFFNQTRGVAFIEDCKEELGLTVDMSGG